MSGTASAPPSCTQSPPGPARGRQVGELRAWTRMLRPGLSNSDWRHGTASASATQAAELELATTEQCSTLKHLDARSASASASNRIQASNDGVSGPAKLAMCWHSISGSLTVVGL